MAIPHIDLGTTLYSNLIRAAVSKIKLGFDDLVDIIKTVELMKDTGTGFFTAYAIQKLGAGGANEAAQIATCQAAFDELVSLHGKLSVDTSVSNVNAAILQAHRKLS